jgi:hypothetical protein
MNCNYDCDESPSPSSNDEIGRNLKIPRDQRLCAICNVLEDEFHFFFKCKRNANNRNIQSVPITTKVVSSNPAQVSCTRYNIM